MRSLIFVALFLITACQTTPVAQHPPAPSAEMVGRQAEFIAFFRLAFLRDGEKPGHPAVPLFRRNKPITVSFPEGEYGIKPLVEQYMNEVQALTGIPYKFGPPPPAYVRVGDIVVHMLPENQIGVRAEDIGLVKTICFASTYHGDSRANGVQTGTEVWISRDLPEEFQRCVSEEFSHAFGVTGDGQLGAPSAFSNHWTPADHRLTAWDRAALWLLYYPDLRPGMMWDEAEPIVRRIVKETWR